MCQTRYVRTWYHRQQARLRPSRLDLPVRASFLDESPRSSITIHPLVLLPFNDEVPKSPLMDCEQQHTSSPVSTRGLPGGSLAHSHGPSLVELLSYGLSPQGARLSSSTQDRYQFNGLPYRATLLGILDEAILIAGGEEGVGWTDSHRSTLRDTLDEATRVDHRAGEPPSPQRASVPAGARDLPRARALQVTSRREENQDGGEALRPAQ